MDFKRLIHEHSDFLVQLFKQLASADGNAVASPISISVTLAMAAAGAKGKTLEQIQACLRMPTADNSTLHDFCSQVKSVVLTDASSAGGPLLTLAAGAWVEQTLSLKPAFKDKLQHAYGAAARSADFLHQVEHVRSEVNTWVKDETKGNITEILPAGSLDEQSKVVLVNALYFKGAWQKPFPASKTTEGSFFLLNGDSVSVPMMATDKKQEISVQDACKVLRLPYSKGQDARSFSMYIVLPNERAGLADLEKSLSVDMLEQYLVPKREVEVGAFKLPRFKISAGYEVPAALSKLGLVHAFSSEADFSEMAELHAGQSLSISNVFHKAFVDVNEEGTEAGAASAAVVALRSINLSPPVEFVADHPFLFVIKEDMTGVVVFLGHVTNPLAATQ